MHLFMDLESLLCSQGISLRDFDIQVFTASELDGAPCTSPVDRLSPLPRLLIACLLLHFQVFVLECQTSSALGRLTQSNLLLACTFLRGSFALDNERALLYAGHVCSGLILRRLRRGVLVGTELSPESLSRSAVFELRSKLVHRSIRMLICSSTIAISPLTISTRGVAIHLGQAHVSCVVRVLSDVLIALILSISQTVLVYFP